MYSLILDYESRIIERYSEKILSPGYKMYSLWRKFVFLFFCQVHYLTESILNSQLLLLSPKDCVSFYLEPMLRQIHLSPISFCITSLFFFCWLDYQLETSCFGSLGFFSGLCEHWILFSLSHKWTIITKALRHYRMLVTSTYPPVSASISLSGFVTWHHFWPWRISLTFISCDMPLICWNNFYPSVSRVVLEDFFGLFGSHITENGCPQLFLV